MSDPSACGGLNMGERRISREEYCTKIHVDMMKDVVATLATHGPIKPTIHHNTHLPCVSNYTSDIYVYALESHIRTPVSSTADACLSPQADVVG